MQKEKTRSSQTIALTGERSITDKPVLFPLILEYSVIVSRLVNLRSVLESLGMILKWLKPSPRKERVLR